MQLEKIVWNFSAYRPSNERRKKISLSPYFIEDGMTLIDQPTITERGISLKESACHFEEEFSFS